MLPLKKVSSLLQLSSGTVVGGDFRILRPLSAGGMGALYVAKQLSTGKQRALKVMHRDLVRDPKSRERFVQEARVGSLIASDHVVEIIAAGVEEDSGVPWLAMELLQGQDLADYIADHGCLSLGELWDVLRQMCHALAAAHQAGVVHRDIKPENVFVAQSRSATAPSFIKILDFGISKIAAQAALTATVNVGSPAWMAPEQADARESITPATDVWALGLMTFWLLTGQSYWRSTDDRKASVFALMREVLFDPLVPASERAEQYECQDRLPAGFDEWFARCVARDPAERFDDAAQLLSTFERLVAAAGVDLPTPTPPPPTSLPRGSTMPLSSAVDPGERAQSDASTTPGVGPLPQREVRDRESDPTAFQPPEHLEGDTERGAKPVKPTAVMAPALMSATSAPTVTDRPRANDELPERVPLRRMRKQIVAVAAMLMAAAALIVFGTGVFNDEDTAEPPTATDDQVASVAVRPPDQQPDPIASVAVAASNTAEPGSTSSKKPYSINVPRWPIVKRPTKPASSALDAGVAPTATSTAGPVPSATAEPAADAGSSKPPSNDAGAGPEPGDPPDTARPFNRGAAIAAVERQANRARARCRRRPGPRVIAGAVVFGTSGKVIGVPVAGRGKKDGKKASVSCVARILGKARVEPFDGEPQRVSVLVSLH